MWKTDVSGYNLRFTELANRNTEIDRHGTPLSELAPSIIRAPRCCASARPATHARVRPNAGAVRDGKDFLSYLPPDKRDNPPELVARVVPDPDEDEYGLEVHTHHRHRAVPCRPPPTLARAPAIAASVTACCREDAACS